MGHEQRITKVFTLWISHETCLHFLYLQDLWTTVLLALWMTENKPKRYIYTNIKHYHQLHYIG